MFRLFAAAYLFCLLIFTLSPLPHSGTELLIACIVCGQRGLADGLLNVVLFIPAGLIFASRLRIVPAVLAGAALSGAIELIQLVVPGRDPSVGDLVFNTAGAVLGAGILGAAPFWLSDDPRRRTLLAAGWAAFVIAAIFLTGWLLRPVPPSGLLSAEWAPQLTGMNTYRGRITAAALGSVQVRPGPAAGSTAWSPLLAQGAPLGVVAEVVTPVDGLAPLLTIHTAGGVEVALLGMDGRDLVFRRLNRARMLRLDSPALRLRDAVDSTHVGRRLLLGTATTRRGQCFAVDRTRTCGVGHTAGIGWSLLLAKLERLPLPGSALNALWLAALVLPIGFFGPPRVAGAALLVIAWYAYIRVPLDTVLLPATSADLGGIAAGVASGLLLRRVSRPPTRPAVQPDTVST